MGLTIAFAFWLAATQRARKKDDPLDAPRAGGRRPEHRGGHDASRAERGRDTRSGSRRRGSGSTSEDVDRGRRRDPGKVPADDQRPPARLARPPPDRARPDGATSSSATPAFDEAFLVEAAPTDVARILLDADAREYRAGHPHVELTIEAVHERRVLRLGVRRWLRDIADGDRRDRRGHADRRPGARGVRRGDAALPAQTAGWPYRPLLDDQRRARPRGRARRRGRRRRSAAPGSREPGERRSRS